MRITEVTVKLANKNEGKVLAYCSFVIDDEFAIRDLKIIDGAKGLFISMPSRRINDRCPECGTKNHLRARYCNQCRNRLDEYRAISPEGETDKLYADTAHPIRHNCRKYIERTLIEAYRNEKELSKQVGYICRYDHRPIESD